MTSIRLFYSTSFAIIILITFGFMANRDDQARKLKPVRALPHSSKLIKLKPLSNALNKIEEDRFLEMTMVRLCENQNQIESLNARLRLKIQRLNEFYKKNIDTLNTQNIILLSKLESYNKNQLMSTPVKEEYLYELNLFTQSLNELLVFNNLYTN